MSKKFNTVEELFEKLTELCSDLDEPLDKFTSPYNLEDCLFEVKGVEAQEIHTEGGEDEGSYTESVWEIKVEGYEPCLICMQGSYSSWDGYDWNYGEWQFCKPVEKQLQFMKLFKEKI